MDRIEPVSLLVCIGKFGVYGSEPLSGLSQLNPTQLHLYFPVKTLI